MTFERRVSKSWDTEDENTLLKLKSEGKTYKYISKTLDRTVSSLKHKYVRLNQSSNEDKHHHPEEKTEQVKKVLRGEGLNILEMNGGKGNLTKVYNGYGKVTTHDINQLNCDYIEELELDNVDVKKVDSFNELHKYVYEKRSYDVVDLDPYGFPSKFFPHVMELLNDGILIVTFPKMGIQQINKIMKEHYRVYWDITLEDKANEQELIHKKMKEFGFMSLKSVELLDVLDLGRVYRFAYKVKRVSALDLVGLKVKGVNC